MMPRRSRTGPLVVLLVALVAGGWFLQQGMAQQQNVYVKHQLFEQLIEYISDRYVEEVDQDALYEHAIEGLIQGLDDPNTSLLDGTAYENFRIQTEGDYGGVGLEISERDEYITVISPIPGGPGSRAGIRPGDLIVEVAGESTREWTVQEAVEVLRGEANSDVEVSVRRPGVDAPIEFTLTREQIQLHAVPFAMVVDGGIGYVPLSTFSEAATREVRAAADSLLEEGATSLVLDLRGNVGGILDQAVGITDLFLPRGVDIVETRGREARVGGTIGTSGGERYEGIPLVVLTDRSSASASEIVAGALQDHDRALIVGTSTFGKGSVQSLFPLSGGNVLKLTTARWYTPQGRSIERVGDTRLDGGDPDEPDDADGTDGADEPDVPGLVAPENAEDIALTVTGQYAPRPDTAGRPRVNSVGGRTLYGGGGIVPDLIMTIDTLTTVEQEAVRELSQEAGQYTSGLFGYAVRFLQQDGNRTPDFAITDDDLEDFYTYLRNESDVTVEAATFRQAERFVRFELESQIAQQGWGESAQFRRRLPYDAPLQRAMGLLGEAASQEDLFARARAAAMETASTDGSLR